jgi:peptidyl-prolyl cis-trans isomerase SurA
LKWLIKIKKRFGKTTKFIKLDKITFNKNTYAMRTLFTGLLIITSILFQPSFAQTIDSIAAVVAKDTIFLSDVDAQYESRFANGETDDGNMKCAILEELMTKSLLITKAVQKNIKVSDKEIDAELERRIKIILGWYQGKTETIEHLMGASISEIRSELRLEVIEQLILKKMKDKILRRVSVSKKEVRQFFEEIPKDNLPLFNVEVELFQIVILSSYSEEAIEKAQAVLMDIYKEVTIGEKDFGELAKRFSMDPGSAIFNGALPEFGRGEMVVELENVVFNMEEGEISPPFKTKYGYHIVKLHKRVDNRITASHILIIPEITGQDKELTYDEINRIKAEIMSESIPFEKATKKWSQDPSLKSNGGYILNPQTGESRYALDMMDADIYLALENMVEGEISVPIEFDPNSLYQSGFRIFYLKKRVEAHTANLIDDYQKVSDAALDKKRNTIMDNWVKKAKKGVYIDIKDVKYAAPIKKKWASQ